MRKVLFITPSTTLAGAESTIKKVALECKRRGNDVLIVVLARGDNGQWAEFERDEILFLNSKRESVGLLQLFFYFLFKRKEVFDSSFTSHIHTNFFVGVLRSLGILKIKSAFYRESTIPFFWYRGLRLFAFRFMYRFYGKPKTVICQTNEMKEQLIANVPSIRNQSLTVIPNSIDLGYVKMMSKDKMSFDEDSSNLIISVGRLVSEKSFDVLILAFKRLLENGRDLKLHIIGEGSERAKLESIIINNKLQDYVKLSGFKVNPVPYMRAAKLCVVSSQIEGFPNVLLEMMAVGRRVVSTKCADGIDKLPGIITCAPNDVVELEDAICSALDSDVSDVKKNIKQMRHHVESRDVKNYYNEIFFNDN